MGKKFIRFEDYEDRIKQALDDKIGIDKNFLKEEFILVEGFFNPIYSAKANKVILGSHFVPMVVLVGKESGQAYWFALKMLLPDENF